MSEQQNRPRDDNYTLTAKSRRTEAFLSEAEKTRLDKEIYPWEHPKHEENKTVPFSLRIGSRHKAKLDYLYDKRLMRSRNEFIAEIICKVIDEQVEQLLIEEKKNARR